MIDVSTSAPSETELEEAGARRLLAAVDELGETEVTADDAMRGVQREIRQLDEEIGKIRRPSDGAFGSKLGLGMRPARPGQ